MFRFSKIRIPNCLKLRDDFHQLSGYSHLPCTNQVATSNCQGSQTGQEVILISFNQLFLKVFD